MLSEGKLNRITKFDRPLLPSPVTVRVVYRKIGHLQYFSHLDLQRTWQRALVRASIPMWYTQGFNPHSKIVYGVPLPVGVEGLEEMTDLRLDREITPEEVLNQLNEELPEEMQVSEVYFPKTSFSDIAYAEYEITGRAEGDPENGLEAVRALFLTETDPILMTKKTKSGEKTIDIRPLIRSLSVTSDEAGVLTIRTILRSGGESNLNPDFLIRALRERKGLFREESSPSDVWYRIVRIGFYDCAGVENGTHFR